jgi:hypothetical protein
MSRPTQDDIFQDILLEALDKIIELLTEIRDTQRPAFPITNSQDFKGSNDSLVDAIGKDDDSYRPSFTTTQSWP